MENIKLYFTILMIFLGGILLLGSLNSTKLEKFNVFEIGKHIIAENVKEYSLQETKTYSCTIEKPASKTVILRVDDIAKWNNRGLMQQMVDDIALRGYGVSLGVIPNRLEEDYKLIKWIQEIETNMNIELSQHGYDHSKEEFVNLNYDEARRKLELGKSIMNRYFGENPLNFIPPYNVESNETMKALKDEGFKTFSGDNNQSLIGEDFAVAGFDTTTFYYEEDRFVYADEVLKDCSDSLQAKGVCVIMMHPQDFTENGKVVDWKYAEYIKVLDGLKKLDADVVNFRQAFCKEY